MTIEKALAVLFENYRKAVGQEWVQKPIAWALYETWKYIDSKEEERETD